MLLPEQELGQYVDEVVDHTKEDFAEKYADAPFDVIVDSVAGARTRLPCFYALLPCLPRVRDQHAQCMLRWKGLAWQRMMWQACIYIPQRCVQALS